MSTTIKQRTPIKAAYVWLYFGLALVLLPHTNYQSPVVSLTCAALFLWRIFFDWGWVPLPSKFLRMVIAFSALASVASMHHTIIGRDAGVSLLLIMTCLKLLEMKNDRDFLVCVCLGYFAVISGFLYNQSIPIGLYLFLAVSLLTTSLISYNKKSSSRQSETANLKLALTLLLQALPLAILIFALFPRVHVGGWGVPQDAANAKTGLSDSMSPGQISQLGDNDSTAFRVEFVDAAPKPGVLYWRGPVFNFFDGKTWKQKNSANIQLDHNNLPITTTSPPLRYRITLEPHNLTWMFALDAPVRIPNNSYINQEYELHASKPIVHIAHYDVDSSLEYQLENHIIHNRHRYLQLPGGIGIKAQQLAIQISANIDPSQSRDLSIVQSALNYFKQQPFYYTRNAPLLPNDPIDEFLFESRKGFCEHYASAFTFIMRASGIPARVVTGYQGGEFNPIGKYFLVKQSDAHAWSEVWLQGRGWTRIDPTAVIPINRIDSLERSQSQSDSNLSRTGLLGKTWKDFNLALDNINHFWNKWFIGYNSNLQSALMAWLGIQNISWELLVAILFGALTISLAFIGIYVIYRTQSPTEPVQKIYARLCRKLSRKGISIHSSEGAMTLSKKAINIHPEWTMALTHISKLYNHIRYGNPQDKPAELRQLRQAVRNFKP